MSIFCWLQYILHVILTLTIIFFYNDLFQYFFFFLLSTSAVAGALQLNLCLLYAKFFMYVFCCDSHVQKAKTSFPIFLQYLKQKFHIKQVASILNTKWHPLKDFLASSHFF